MVTPIERMTDRLSKDLQAFQRLRGRLNTEILRTTPEVRAPQLGLPDVTDPLRRGLVEVDRLMSQAEGEFIKTIQRLAYDRRYAERR